MTALFEQENGEYTIKFENGKIKTTSPEYSLAQHNLLCYGRLNKNMTTNPKNRLGWSGAAAYAKAFFSTAWKNYLEGNITQENISVMITDFNQACNRDFLSGLVSQKVAIKSVYKLDKTTLKINMTVGSDPQSIVISI